MTDRDTIVLFMPESEELMHICMRAFISAVCILFVSYDMQQ